MEGEFANEANSTLESALGRGVCNGELYAAHFLGPDAACRLIEMNHATPNASAAAFPQAASANKNMFYHADGSAKSVHKVYDWALRQPSGAQLASASPAAEPAKTAYAGGPSDDWLATQMFAATDSGGLSLTGQAPFVLTPDVMQILSSPNGADVNDRSSAN
jgi:hypothetical protein